MFAKYKVTSVGKEYTDLLKWIVLDDGTYKCTCTSCTKLQESKPQDDLKLDEEYLGLTWESKEDENSYKFNYDIAGIKKVKIQTESGNLPTQGTNKSAGYDLVATSININGEKLEGSESFKSINFIEYGTGIYISPESSEGILHGFVFPRSSISKYNLSLANSVGVIDNDYRGEIKVRFKYHLQPDDIHYDTIQRKMYVNIDHSKIYKVGDKIAQIVFFETDTIAFEKLDKLDSTERGAGGFGSTGK